MADHLVDAKFLGIAGAPDRRIAVYRQVDGRALVIVQSRDGTGQMKEVQGSRMSFNYYDLKDLILLLTSTRDTTTYAPAGDEIERVDAARSRREQRR